jgi:amino acid transporter
MNLKPGEWFAGAFVALLAWLAFYVMALAVSGMLVYSRNFSEECSKGPLANYEERFIPPSTKCLYRDGTSEQLVSPVINPVLFLMLAVVLVLFLLGLRALFTKYGRTPPPEAPIDDRP